MNSDVAELDCSSLKERVGSRLLDVEAPLAACRTADDGPACAAALASLRNPWAIEEYPGAFQATGWHGAYVSAHSPRTVAARPPAARRLRPWSARPGPAAAST